MGAGGDERRTDRELVSLCRPGNRERRHNQCLHLFWPFGGADGHNFVHCAANQGFQRIGESSGGGAKRFQQGDQHRVYVMGPWRNAGSSRGKLVWSHLLGSNLYAVVYATGGHRQPLTSGVESSDFIG